MRFVLNPPTAILVQHHGNTLEFSIAGTNSYQSTQLVNIVQDDSGNRYDPFADINDYIQTLDREQRDKLFECYERAADQFTEILSLDELKENLTNIFADIYDIVTIEGINKWMVDNDRVKIPVSIEDNVSSHYQEERTYTPEKYKGLISLSVGLKQALPIWGAVVRYITKGTGVGRKEIHCAHLLKKSTLINSPQFDDFFNFVVSTYEVGKAKADSVLTGVGTEEQITLLPSACLVRKIAVSPNLKSRSAVTEAYNYVVNQGPGHERKHPQIRPKQVEKGVPVEEQSLLETYKVKESVSVGDIELITLFCENFESLIRDICPTITDEYIRRGKEMLDLLIKKDFDLEPQNLLLIQWFVDGVPPQLIPHLDPRGFIDLIRFNFAGDKSLGDPEQYQTHAKKSLAAALFTALMYMGYPAIALMVTSRAATSEIDTSIGNSRRQIPADIDAKLDDIFPIRISGTKEPVNMAKDAIAQYFNAYSGRTFSSIYTPWFNTMVEEHIDREGNHYLKPETPITLAKIVIDIYGEN